MDVEETLPWWVTSYVLYYAMLAVVLISLVNYLRGDSMCRWWSPLQQFRRRKPAVKLDAVKRQLFSTLGGEVSRDPHLRDSRALRILEVGVGTGSNFAYYPPGTHVVVVDPDPGFAKYFQENKDRFSNIRCEKIITSTGEQMHLVNDGSIDVVVMTQVLCTIDDPHRILQEIIRVLTPGGKFYFFEHIREFDGERHRLRQKLQDLLTTSGVAPYFLDGCCLNKDMLPAIGSAGFSKVRAERFYAPIDDFIYQLVKPCLKGIAEK